MPQIAAENFTIQFHTDRQPLFKSPRFITKRNSVTPPSFNCYSRVGTVDCTSLYFVARFIGNPQPNTMVSISTVQPLQNQEFLCAGTPLIRQFLLGQISNKDGFLKLKNSPIF